MLAGHTQTCYHSAHLIMLTTRQPISVGKEIMSPPHQVQAEAAAHLGWRRFVPVSRMGLEIITRCSARPGSRRDHGGWRFKPSPPVLAFGNCGASKLVPSASPMAEFDCKDACVRPVVAFVGEWLDKDQNLVLFDAVHELALSRWELATRSLEDDPQHVRD